MNYKYSHKLWAITDLINVINKYKHEFERANDIEKLNSTQLFQHLIGLIFYCKCDSGTIKYDNKTSERLSIRICKCHTDTIIIHTEVLQKYKRSGYYYNTLFLDTNTNPVDNQRLLANWILHNPLLLNFFRCTGDIV